MKKIICIFALLSILLPSCGILKDKSLAKRYRNSTNLIFQNAKDPQSFVQVDAKSILVKEAAEKDVKFNVLSLSDKGQQAFIESANLKSKDAKELMELLNSNFAFTKEEKSNIRIIPKTLRKSIVFTIDRLQYQFANNKTTFNLFGDRISYLQLDVRLATSSKAIFNSWDRFVTDKLTLNLGKVSSAQNWNASLNLSAKTGAEASLVGSNSTEGFESDKTTGTTTLVNNGLSGTNTNGNALELISTGKGTDSKTNSLKTTGELGGSASIGYTDKYETSVDLTSQILKLSGTLAENKIILRQEGGPSIDLSGNVSVLVEYAITDDWAKPIIYSKYKDLYSGSTLNDIANIKQSLFMVIYPDINNDITGELNYSFLYRQVNKGNKHLPEARQKVTFWYGNVPYDKNIVTEKKAIVLINKNDIRPKAYQITLNSNPLNLRTTEMLFETISEATTFLSYINDLIQNGRQITALTASGTPLTNGDFSSLRITTKQF